MTTFTAESQWLNIQQRKHCDIGSTQNANFSIIKCLGKYNKIYKYIGYWLVSCHIQLCIFTIQGEPKYM